MTAVNDGNRQEQEGSSRDLVDVLFRKKWVILVVFLSAVIPVVAYMVLLKPEYESKALLLVKPGRENIYVSPVGAPEGTMGPTITQRVSEVINSEIQILKSRILIGRVLEGVGIAKVFPPSLSEESMVADVREFFPRKVMAKVGLAGVVHPTFLDDSLAANGMESPSLAVAVRRALGNLSVARISNTDVIEVTFKSRDPDVPAGFVTKLVDLYLERHLELHSSGRGYQFFKNQSSHLEKRLENAAKRLADFKKKYGIVSFDKRKVRTLDDYSRVYAEIQKNQASIVATESRIDTLKKKLAGMSEQKYLNQSEATDPAPISTLKAKLSDLELKKAELLQKYQPEHSKVADVVELIARTQELLAAEEEEFHGSVTTGVNATYQGLERSLHMEEVKLEGLRSSSKELEELLIKYGRQLERLGLLEPELRDLERAVNLNEQSYRLYISKFEESRVSDAMDAAKMVSVTVLEPAKPPLGPIPERKGLKIFVSVCLGGLAALGLAFLVEYFDHTFKVPEDIREKLYLAVLGSVRNLKAKEMEGVEALAIAPKPPLFYQTIRSSVVMHAKEKKVKMLAVCSATPGEGASTVALNLAVSLVKDNKCRVLLVDANLQNPGFHGTFGLSSSPGLSGVLLEGADIHEAVQESMISNLWVLTSGVTTENPMAILESERLEELTKTLTQDFDWIIFDSAPIKHFPDASVLMRRLDGAIGLILVVQAEHKKWEIAAQAKEGVEEAGAKVLGAVLNRQRHVIPEVVYKRL
jgi:capsular exopolysaccharide synthesis family protein